MSESWLKLFRRLRENEIWRSEPFSRGQAWVDLLMLANHKKGILSVRGNIVPIERGQVGWCERRLAEEWKWSRGRVRNFLALLERLGQISRKTSPQTSPQKSKVLGVITITNYGKYQTEKPADDTTDDTTESPQKAHRQNPNKKDKKVKNDNTSTKVEVATPERIDHRNPDVERLLACLKDTMGLTVLDGTIKNNRFCAKRIADKVRKQFPKEEDPLALAEEGIKNLVKQNFHRTKMTNMAYVEKNILSAIISSPAFL
jgi:hypothetical protein